MHLCVCCARAYVSVSEYVCGRAYKIIVVCVCVCVRGVCICVRACVRAGVCACLWVCVLTDIAQELGLRRFIQCMPRYRAPGNPGPVPWF